MQGALVARREEGGVAVHSGRTRRRRVPRSARARRLLDAAPLQRSRTRFCRRLTSLLGAPVQLEITDNTYTMISFTKRGGGYRVRLHHMFLDAPAEVEQTLVAYIRGDDRRSSQQLDAFIHENRRLIRRMTPAMRQKRLPLRSRGRIHDLGRLLEGVRREFRAIFGHDADDVAIAWAPAPKVKLPRRSIKLGSYSADTQIIRIHPALDQAAVPDHFIRWIVFHELLHHKFRADLKARNGRVHTPEFCALERQYPRYREALLWERMHLDLLLWWQPPTDLLRRLLKVG